MADSTVACSGSIEAGRLPLERGGCRITRTDTHPYEVRHKRFPDRRWLARDLNTALQICHELNCE